MLHITFNSSLDCDLFYPHPLKDTKIQKIRNWSREFFTTSRASLIPLRKLMGQGVWLRTHSYRKYGSLGPDTPRATARRLAASQGSDYARQPPARRAGGSGGRLSGDLRGNGPRRSVHPGGPAGHLSRRGLCVPGRCPACHCSG